MLGRYSYALAITDNVRRSFSGGTSPRPVMRYVEEKDQAQTEHIVLSALRELFPRQLGGIDEMMIGYNISAIYL